MASGRTKNLEKILFQLFIFLLPVQLGRHFWPEWAFVYGIRVDYFSPTIYLTDVVLAFLLVVYLLKRIQTRNPINKKTLQFVAGLVALALVNITLSNNWQVSFIKWVKIFELSALTAYVGLNKSFKIKKAIKTPLLLGVLTVSLVGLVQFSLQRTIGGWFYFLGERSFNVLTPGTALVKLFDREYMRAYSTFSHPNSFAGYLSASLLLLWNLGIKKKSSLLVVIFLGGAALTLSFSRGAFLSLFLISLIILVAKKRLLNFKTMTKSLLIAAVSLSILFPILTKRVQIESSLPESISMRISLSNAAGKLIAKSPLIGNGLNNYIVNLPPEIIGSGFDWTLQPVHNIFLLAFAEVGLIGLLLLTFLFWKALERKEFILPLVFVLISGMFDHYWLTLQQNMLFLSLLFGLSFRKT